MLLDVLLPRGCAGCDKPDEVLCGDCQDLFAHSLAHALPGSVLGQSFAAAHYAGAARHAILAWKDHDDVELDRPFADVAAALAERCGLGQWSRPLVVVPAPSSRASMRRRGRRHIAPLSHAVAETLGAEERPCLTSSAARKSVQTSSARQRASRAEGSLTVIPGTSLAGMDVVIVDDIITTGSTMRQCAAALREAGARVVTGLALAGAGQFLTT